MLFVCVYDKDAAFEPAEGGYFVEVQSLRYALPVSRRKARKVFAEVVQEIKAEYAYCMSDYKTFEEGDYDNACFGSHHYPEFCVYHRRYVGDGVEVHIEKRPGAHETEYLGYC